MTHDDVRYTAVGFAVTFAVLLLGSLIVVPLVKAWVW